MTRALRDPRIRRLAVLVLLVLVVALGWHLVGMGAHLDIGMALMGSCAAVLVAIGSVVAPRVAVLGPLARLAVPAVRTTPPPPTACLGRHPPSEGTCLRR